MNITYENFKGVKLHLSLDEKLQNIKSILGNTSDLLINPMEIGGVKICVIAFEGMISTSNTSKMIMIPLMGINLPQNTSPDELFYHIKDKMMLTLDRVISETYEDILTRAMSGFAIILIDGCDKAFSLGVQGYDKRGIDEPSSEGNITGSHEGFVETVRTNMSLVRRRIKSPVLRFSLFSISQKSNVDVILCYMADRVSKELIDFVKARLEKIPLETILGCGYTAPFLNNSKLSVFSGLTTTERPDTMCSALIEGRIGLLIEGTPFAIIIPSLFSDNFHTIDDYNFRPFFATFARIIRYLSFAVSVFFPGIYVSAVIFHPEMLRAEFLANLKSAEENAPLPVLAEALIILIFYEIIREAGVRLPKAVGGAVSIIGGLVIGDTAVSAGVITNPMLLVCAVSVTAAFTIPSLHEQISVLRLLCVIFGGFFGMFGVGIICAFVILSACSVENYGVPMTSPITPFTRKAFGDIILRQSLKRLSEKNITVDDYYGANMGETQNDEN